MKLFLLVSLVLLIATTAVAQTSPEGTFTLSEIVKTQKVRLSGPKDRYHSLDFSLMATMDSEPGKPPKEVEFTLISVVKDKRLNSDLYVVFVVDGEELHFGSNRSAIKRPVPGRPWVGERIVFKIPYEDYLKLTAANKLAIKMGGVVFDFGELAQKEVRLFLRVVVKGY